MPKGLLADQLTLVTGAGGGLGAAIAERFAFQGAKVIVCDIKLATAKETAQRIVDAGGVAWAEELNVADRQAVNEFTKRITETLGPIGVLVNNAGIGPRVKFEDPGAVEAWDEVISVNLTSMFDITRAFLPALKSTRGCIVNMASVAAFVGGNASVGYGAAKGGVRSLTQILAKQLGPYGIRVNAIAPGVFPNTGITAGRRTEAQGRDPYLDRAPLGRYGEGREVADVAVFFASEMASYVNGTTLPVDGGFLAC